MKTHFEIREFKLWKKWVAENGRCQATTAKGQQCKNPCADMGRDICGEGDFHTVQFIAGETDRCGVHIEVDVPAFVEE